MVYLIFIKGFCSILYSSSRKKAILEHIYRIYDLKREIPEDDLEPETCNTPSFLSPQNSRAKYDQRRKKEIVLTKTSGPEGLLY